MNIIRNITRSAIGLGVLAIGLSSAIDPAAASGEFPPFPAATITAKCTKWLGPLIHIDYSNVGGQSDAVFTATVNGATFTDVIVAPNTTAFQESQLPDDDLVPVTISAPGMQTVVTSVGPLDCYNGTSTIRVDCVNDVPTMTATATNTGQSINTATLVINNDIAKPSKKTVAPGETETFSYAIPDGVPYTGRISFDQGGTESNIAGTPMCVPPTTQTTVPETTVPETTAPPTTAAPTVPPTTAPPAIVIVDAPTTVALTVPVGTVLPSTGKSSMAIAWIGLLAVGFGLMVTRAARRPRSAR
jgi:LPXTG-motif cell wall-anchored protein